LGGGDSPNSPSPGSAFLVLFALFPSALGLDAVDEKVAQVSELCIEINNKIGDQQRRELATF